MMNRRGYGRTGKQTSRRALFRFRLIVRLVILNRKWLTDAEEHKITLNYKKNIAMYIRPQQKTGMLTISEKALIRKQHENRSIEERKQLVHLLAGLPCFAIIPPKLRARLVPVIHVAVLDRDQELIREGTLPMTVYFILTGEVEAYKRVYDPRNKQYYNNVEYMNGPGDWVGDVDLIEKREKRQYSFKAKTITELLVLYDDDFDRILRPYMTQQWENRKNALKSLEYFNFFDEDQIETATRLCEVRQFEPLETIYYEDKGAISYVHFILCGECMILQRLRMKVRDIKGEKIYKLIAITHDTAYKQDFQGRMTLDVLKQLKSTTDTRSAGSDFAVASQRLLKELEEENQKEISQRGQEELAKVEAACRNKDLVKIKPARAKSFSHRSLRSKRSEQSNKSDRSERRRKFKREKLIRLQPLDRDDDDMTSLKSSATYRSLYFDEEEFEEEESSLKAAGNLKSVSVSLFTRGEEINEEEINEEEINEEIVIDEKNELKRNDNSARFGYVEELLGKDGSPLELKSSSSSATSSSWSSTSTSLSSYDIKQKIRFKAQKTRMENHFIDVGSLFNHGIFGLGEEMKDRVIMARTVVQCLLVPRFWLFEKHQNPGNVWGRRRFYIDHNVPTRLQLFHNFLETRKWQAFKTDFVESSIKDFAGNFAKSQDLPIIAHITEN